MRDQWHQKFFDYLLYEKGCSKNTIVSYQNDLNEFFDFLNKKSLKRLDKITYSILHQYITEIGESGLKASTIERRVASLKSFFKFLKKNGVIDKNPAGLISSPKKDKKLPTVLDPKEIMDLIESIPDTTPLSIRNKTIIVLLYASGIRVSEISGLDLSHIDFQEGMIRVLGKGRQERDIPIGETARKALIRYLPYRKELEPLGTVNQALFLTKSGKRIQDRMIRYLLSHYIQQISIQKKVTPHTLRHTFATHMLTNGANIRAIQELLGHSSLSTTQIYTHLSINELRQNYLDHHPHA